MATHISGVCFAHDDVEDTDVAAVLGGVRADHPVLGLQQSAHDFEDSSSANRLCGFNVLACEGGVAGLQEVAAWCRDQRGDDADKIVVHVSRIAQGGRRGTHDGTDKLIGLLERRCLDVQSVCSNTREGAIVEDDDTVGMLSESLHGQQRVVWLDNDIS